MSDGAWLDSQDQTIAHNNAQWLRCSSGTGNVKNANNGGPMIVGWAGQDVSGPFPNGGFGAEESFIELNTAGFPVGDGQLAMTPSFAGGTLTGATTANMRIAARDWGGTPINFAAQWRTPAQLTALTIAGSVPQATVQAAMTAGTPFLMPVASSAINRAGLSRFVVYWDLLANDTQPALTGNPNMNFIWNVPVEADLTILSIVPFKNPGIMTASSIEIQSTFPIQTNFGSMILNEVIQLANPIAVSTLNAIGVNTVVNIPTGTTAITIVPPTNNVNALTLKGVAGDTGIAISKTQPTEITVDPTQVSFVLNAGAATTVQLTFM